MDEHLSGKVAIITGGMNGIGKECAATLLHAGADVVIADLDTTLAETVITEISTGTERQVQVVKVDVSSPDQCHRLVQQASQLFGHLDILINCAGLFVQQPALEMEATRWRQVFDVNVHGAYYCAQAFARHIVKQKTDGAIINISSISSTQMMPERAAYSASKAALNALTQALAFEWAGYNIRVNAIAPSHVNTPGIRQVAQQGRLDLSAISSRIPMGRIAEPEEIADAVLFLCGKQSRFITGQIIAVDGGYSVNGSW
jgi:NAD(P)-dependent dehydrogenase (short-subunit alcohol dehydrogenase family)